MYGWADFLRAALLELCTRCKSTGLGLGLTDWVGWTTPRPGAAGTGGQGTLQQSAEAPLRSGAAFGYDAHACPLHSYVNGSVRKPQTRRQSPKMPSGPRFHVSSRQRPKHEVELTYRFDAARLHDTAKHDHRITIQVPRMYNRAEIVFSHTGVL